MTLMELLGGVGDVMDTPGRLARTALAGRNPLDALFDPSQGVSGRQLLEQYGLVGANEDQGWMPDAGDIGGFAAETILDPTNLLGGGLLKKLLGKAGKAKAANKMRDAVLDSNRAAQKTNIASDILSRQAVEARDLDQIRAYHGRSNGPADVSIGNITPEDQAMFNQWNFKPSEQDQRDFLFGTRDQAAQSVARGIGVQLEPPTPLLQSLASGGEFNTYGYNAPLTMEAKGKFSGNPVSETPTGENLYRLGETRGAGLAQVLGAVPQKRPDILLTSGSRTDFVDPINDFGLVRQADHSIPLQAGIGTHEAVHSLSGLYPDKYGELASGLSPASRTFGDSGERLGDLSSQALTRRFGGDSLTTALYQLANLKSHKEEGLATAIGEAIQHGGARQRFPSVDAMFTNHPGVASADDGLAGELAALLKMRYPKSEPANAKAASQILMDFLQGNFRKQRALAPTGAGVLDESMPRSFFQGSFTPGPQDYASLMAVPDLQRIPRTSPLLAALLGHNAVARSHTNRN